MVTFNLTNAYMYFLLTIITSKKIILHSVIMREVKADTYKILYNSRLVKKY